MPAAAPVTMPAPRRRQVSVVVLLAALAGGFIWGLAMFVAGRSSVPAPIPSHDEAAHIAYLTRVDQALIKRDVEGARLLLAGPSLADDQTSTTALAVRRAQLTTLDESLRAEAAARTTAAWVAKLDRHLIKLATGALLTLPMVTTTTSATPLPAAVSAPALAAIPHGLVYLPDPSESERELAPQTLDGKSFIPSARIAHPSIAKRHYALHPTRGLLRSDDDGMTWRASIGALAGIQGTKLSFSLGEHPVLLVMGQDVWMFADEDGAPGFFLVP